MEQADSIAILPSQAFTEEQARLTDTSIVIVATRFNAHHFPSRYPFYRLVLLMESCGEATTHDTNVVPRA